MLRRLLLVLTLALVGLLAAASSLPDSFRIRRGLRVPATRDQVFPLLADVRLWPRWSPWKPSTPGAQPARGRPVVGRGASLAVAAHDGRVGGSIEILEANPPRHLALQLHVHEPFEASYRSDLELEADGLGTRVTWSVRGTQPLPAKVLDLYVDLEEWLGRDLEQGLVNLKATLEREAP